MIGADYTGYLYGDDDNDVLYGGVAYDNLFGGAGDDFLVARGRPLMFQSSKCY